MKQKKIFTADKREFNVIEIARTPVAEAGTRKRSVEVQKELALRCHGSIFYTNGTKDIRDQCEILVRKADLPVEILTAMEAIWAYMELLSLEEVEEEV